jgi:cell division protein FtsB
MRTLVLSLLAIVLLLQYRLWVGDSGMREVWRLRREVATQQDVNRQLKDRNRTLAAEVQDLKKGKSAVEERARTDLGMVGSNETFFQVAPGSMTPSKTSSVLAVQTDKTDVKSSGGYNATSDRPEVSRPLAGAKASVP